jgi:hypothetical protein
MKKLRKAKIKNSKPLEIFNDNNLESIRFFYKGNSFGEIDKIGYNLVKKYAFEVKFNPEDNFKTLDSYCEILDKKLLDNYSERDLQDICFHWCVLIYELVEKGILHNSDMDGYYKTYIQKGIDYKFVTFE